jgi:translation initiation factor IF-2
MADITVAELAKEIGTPVDRLVTQLADSGVKKIGFRCYFAR